MIELSLTNFNSNIVDEDNEMAANTVNIPLLTPLNIQHQEGGPKTTQYENIGFEFKKNSSSSIKREFAQFHAIGLRSIESNDRLIEQEIDI